MTPASSSLLPDKNRVVSNNSVNSFMEPVNFGSDLFRLEADDSSGSSSLVSSTETQQVLIQRMNNSLRQLNLKEMNRQETEQWQVERHQGKGESSNEESGLKQNIRLERKQRDQRRFSAREALKASRQESQRQLKDLKEIHRQESEEGKVERLEANGESSNEESGANPKISLERKQRDQRRFSAREALKASRQDKWALRDLMGRKVQTIEVLQQELSSANERVLVLEAQLETVPALEQQLEQAREAMKAAQQEKEAMQARLEGLCNQHQVILEPQPNRQEREEGKVERREANGE
jgi:hypothetical protein